MPISLRSKVALTLGGFLLLAAGPMVLAHRSSTAFLASSTAVVGDQAAVAELHSVRFLDKPFRGTALPSLIGEVMAEAGSSTSRGEGPIFRPRR
jgi:hypothetical protein